ncbi:MAG: tetratricopeptide repeat protein [Gammaproteobacteria bacterium]|nr:tetratricopeptide repeat protein [Gammaproteobacteria bacterium]
MHLMRLFGVFLALMLSFAVSAEDTSNSLISWERLVNEGGADAGEAYYNLIKFFGLTEPKRALRHIASAEAYFKQHPNIHWQSLIKSEHAYVLMSDGQLTEAMAKALESIEYATRNREPQALARAIMNRGSVQYSIGDFETALQSYQDAGKRYEVLGDTLGVLSVDKNIGNVLVQMGQYEQAEAIYRDIIKRSQRDPRFEGEWAVAEEGLARTLSYMERLDESLPHFRESIRLTERQQQGKAMQYTLSGMATVLLKLGKNEEALATVERAIDTMRRGEAGLFLGTLLTLKSEILLASGRKEDALLSVQQGLSFAESQKDAFGLSAAWEALSVVYKAQGQYQRALEAIMQSQTIREKMTNERALARVAVLAAAYQAERTQHEIDVLNAKTNAQQAELQNQRNQTYFLATLSLLTLCVLGFGLYRRHNQQIVAEHQRVNDKLVELDRVKDQVLANTSHELRTPLNGIVGLSELLLSDELTDEARSHVQMIADSGRRLTRLVDDLLDLSSMRQGKFVLHQAAVELAPLVRQVIALSASAVLGRPVRFHNQVPNELPKVWADKERLLQVLHNLIGNAAKFTEKGAVTVNANLEGGMVRVSVVDTGGGIPPEKLHTIFDAFEQADSGMTRRHQGAGLGLAIARQLVELHGGQIGVQSTPGTGSLFWFTLPLAMGKPLGQS